MKTYKIVRLFADCREKKVVKTRLTLEEAQAHCSRDDTRGPGWFDGYTDEDPTEDEVLERLSRDMGLLKTVRKISGGPRSGGSFEDRS